MNILLNGNHSYKMCPSLTAVHHSFYEASSVNLIFLTCSMSIMDVSLYWIVIFVTVSCLYSKL